MLCMQLIKLYSFAIITTYTVLKGEYTNVRRTNKENEL